jgi:hypothetical protein
MSNPGIKVDISLTDTLLSPKGKKQRKPAINREEDNKNEADKQKEQPH